MPTYYAETKLTKRATFQPIPGHPGGAKAKPASLPAGTRVRVTPDSKGTWTVLASVDGTDDYVLRGAPDNALELDRK